MLDVDGLKERFNVESTHTLRVWALSICVDFLHFSKFSQNLTTVGFELTYQPLLQIAAFEGNH